MEQERLQKINKILLATGTINYLAAHVHTINKEKRFYNSLRDDEPHRESIHDQEQTLTKVLLHLDKAMNELGEYMEGYDCLMPLDLLIVQPSFSILSHGMDEVDRTDFITE